MSDTLSLKVCVLSLSYLAHSKFIVLIFHCTFMKCAGMSLSKEDFSPRNEFDKKSKLFIANG